MAKLRIEIEQNIDIYTAYVMVDDEWWGAVVAGSENQAYEKGKQLAQSMWVDRKGY